MHLTCRLLGGLVLTGSIDRNTISLVFVSPDTEQYFLRAGSVHKLIKLLSDNVQAPHTLTGFSKEIS